MCTRVYCYWMSDLFQCSQTCGFGTKDRQVYCVDRRGQRVDPQYCAQQHRPKPRRRCNEFPCPYIWNTSPWSEVRESIGFNLLNRNQAPESFYELVLNGVNSVI